MVAYINNAWLQFAEAYGACPYSEGVYNNGLCSTATGGGSLVNTGTVIVGIATAACFLVFAALVVRFWKRKRGHSYTRLR